MNLTHKYQYIKTIQKIKCFIKQLKYEIKFINYKNGLKNYIK